LILCLVTLLSKIEVKINTRISSLTRFAMATSIVNADRSFELLTMLAIRRKRKLIIKNTYATKCSLIIKVLTTKF